MAVSLVSALFVLLLIGLGASTSRAGTFPAVEPPSTPEPPESSTDSPRNLWQFANMVRYTTNRSPWDFTDYGCYCGWGGAGNPVDDLDRCCKVHDECYERVKTFFCQPKLVTYSWRKNNGKVECYKGWFDDDCDLSVCECDRDAAHCFASVPYNEQNFDIDQSLCHT